MLQLKNTSIISVEVIECLTRLLRIISWPTLRHNFSILWDRLGEFHKEIVDGPGL